MSTQAPTHMPSSRQFLEDTLTLRDSHPHCLEVPWLRLGCREVRRSWREMLRINSPARRHNRSSHLLHELLRKAPNQRGLGRECCDSAGGLRQLTPTASRVGPEEIARRTSGGSRAAFVDANRTPPGARTASAVAVSSPCVQHARRRAAEYASSRMSASAPASSRPLNLHQRCKAVLQESYGHPHPIALRPPVPTLAAAEGGRIQNDAVEHPPLRHEQPHIGDAVSRNIQNSAPAGGHSKTTPHPRKNVRLPVSSKRAFFPNLLSQSKQSPNTQS